MFRLLMWVLFVGPLFMFWCATMSVLVLISSLRAIYLGSLNRLQLSLLPFGRSIEMPSCSVYRATEIHSLTIRSGRR